MNASTSCAPHRPIKLYRPAASGHAHRVWLRAWLARIEALPGLVPMMKSRVGLNA
jgi:hypothetical protein